MPIVKGLEWTFNTRAELYDRMRPGYPKELYQDLFAYKPVDAASRAVEVGIGAGQATRPVLETGNTDILTQMLLKNMGVSFLPEFVVRDYLADGRLAALDTVCPEIEMWSQLVYHRNKLVTPQMEIFLDLMKKNMESRE